MSNADNIIIVTEKGSHMGTLAECWAWYELVAPCYQVTLCTDEVTVGVADCENLNDWREALAHAISIAD